MRTVAFLVTGGMGGESQQAGTVADLLMAIPYLLVARITPPLHVVNDILDRGRSDSGMSGGCQWDPFQITATEWVDVAAVLKSMPDDKACEFVQPPSWVETADDWHAWVMMHQYGLPDEFRALEREVRDLERARTEAMSEGNQALVDELHLRVVIAGGKLSDVLMRHRNNTGS